MNRRRHLLTILLALLAPMLLASACGGKKRGPAVATGAPGSGTGTQSGEQPVDSGPDIRSVDPDTAQGEDFAVSDQSGEGGPLEDVHFEYDQAELSDQARATLERNAQWMKAHPAAKVRVEGHCDDRGTVEYNLALGRGRPAGHGLLREGEAARHGHDRERVRAQPPGPFRGIALAGATPLRGPTGARPWAGPGRIPLAGPQLKYHPGRGGPS
jgi:hypothetical protein